jgi:peroxiredoxin (alkyl hydroperoxide reductase subunit C)
MAFAETRGVQAVSLEVGDSAPDFDLPALLAGVKGRFRLSDQRGKKHVVLVFYPFNWEAVSGQQLSQYQAEREKIEGLGAETVAICVESIMNTTAWEREIGPFDFPLCSDFWPHGAVAEKYGVLRTHGQLAGACERAIFVVNKSGVIAFRRRYGVDEMPKLVEALDILQGS